MRVLRAGGARPVSGPRPGRRVYDDAVREALIVLWEASDRICGKRLRPMVPVLVESTERHGHLQLAAEVRARLLAKYSPDLNPIKQVFAKLKHLLRKAQARSRDAVCTTIGALLRTYTPQECAD